MERLTGTLQYLGRDRRWLLVSDKIETDLRPLFKEVFKKLHGQPTMLDVTNFLVSVYKNAGSVQVMDFYEEDGEEDMTILKSAKMRESYKNVFSIVSQALQRLNGRKVFVEMEGEKITLHSDDCLEDYILGLYLNDRGYCKIPPGKEKSVCRANKKGHSCLFLLKDIGQYLCCKFNFELTEKLLALHDNNMVPEPARFIGNCALMGMKKGG